jgi:drug/metabolite transporter (DMT)-like permease
VTLLPLTRIPTRHRLVLAFASLYLIWGSTYLAIRYAIATIPPFLMGGTRLLVAGAVLYAWARRRGAPPPGWERWRGAAIVGAFLFLGGNGAVVWSQQSVPSGLAALVVATVPLWMVLLESLRRDGLRAAPQELLGVAIGMLGIGLLIGPGRLVGGGRPDPVGTLVLVLGSLSWAHGSLVARRVSQPPSPLLATGLQMLAGGALLFLAGLVVGEGARLDLPRVTLRSWLCLAYLVVFGSIIAFTAYVWLLRVTTPARVATYAYVNPVVAVLLGWLLAGEPLTPRVLLAAAVIVGAVALIVTSRGRRTSSLP